MIKGNPYGINDSIRHSQEYRRNVLLTLDSKHPFAGRPRTQRQEAEIAGHHAAALQAYLGLRKTWTARDYVACVVLPMYVAGCCGTGLYDEWTAKCSRARVNDPRVKIFIEEAQKVTDRETKEESSNDDDNKA